MTGSSSMLTGRIRWFTLLLLLLPVLLGMGGEALPWVTPFALAAGKHLENTSGDCKGEHHQPSFGGTIVVDTGEVVCGDLTSFGGTVAINGEVRGDVVSFGGEVVIAGTVDGTSISMVVRLLYKVAPMCVGILTFMLEAGPGATARSSMARLSIIPGI